MKRVVLAIKNGLVLEAVSNALKRGGFLVTKTSSQEVQEILNLTNSLLAHLLIMDVGKSEDCTFDKRMDIVKLIKNQNPNIKIAFLVDNVSNKNDAYKIKCVKEEGKIDTFFYESVPSDYIVDVLDSL